IRLMGTRGHLTNEQNRQADKAEKKKPRKIRGFSKVADRTGLEPATSGVTGRHSNQLNYRSAKLLQQQNIPVINHQSGGRYKTRTCDPCLVRALLYQLS